MEMLQFSNRGLDFLLIIGDGSFHVAEYTSPSQLKYCKD